MTRRKQSYHDKKFATPALLRLRGFINQLISLCTLDIQHIFLYNKSKFRMYNHAELIDATLLAQAVFEFCFLVSSLAVASNAYAGFVVVTTGILFTLFTGLTYYGIRHATSRTLFGVILGGSFVLVLISLQVNSADHPQFLSWFFYLF